MNLPLAVSAIFTLVALSAVGTTLSWNMWNLTPPDRASTRERTESHILFDELVDNELLTTDGSMVILKPTDEALANEWRNPAPTAEIQRVLDLKKQLLNDLYRSEAGKFVRDEVLSWNRSRRVIAVRDNGASKGVPHRNWQAHNCASGSHLNAKSTVAETFGYLHQGRLRTGFGDWTSQATDTECVEWRGTFNSPQSTDLEIWYVGLPTEQTSWEPSNIQPISYEPPRELTLPKCAMANGIPTKQAGAWRIPKHAWRQNAKGTWDLTVRLRLAPARNPSMIASEGTHVCVTRTCKPVWKQTSQKQCVSRKQELATNEVTATTVLPLPAQRSKPHPVTWQIKTSDGVALITEGLDPTEDAMKLGLVPLVGTSAKDQLGLGARLNFVPPGGELTLTIDSKIQTLTRAALSSGLKRLPARTWDNLRRAALVLVGKNGEILAAAGVPEPPPPGQVTEWDRRAFAQVYPLNDPFLVRAWEGVDRNQTAGSTFKPVTALAGLWAAAEMPHISSMIRGLNPASFYTLTGLGLRTTAINPRLSGPGGAPDRGGKLINNFINQGRETPLSALCKTGKKGGIDCSDPKYNLGLASAVRESMNIWFVALAMQLDGADADAYQNLKDYTNPPDLHLVRTLKKLGFAAEVSPLFANPPVGFAKNNFAFARDQFDLLRKPPTPTRWILAQTSIGQGVFVTPLRMATMAATIAGKATKAVQPHLDAAWNGTPVVPTTPTFDAVDTTLLQDGMQAVILNGTAQTAFKNMPPAIREHTYAKTGTAQVGTQDGRGLEPYVTVWTVGWHESQSTKFPVVAFACMVTHIDKTVRDKNTGGWVCGPIVAELLRSLNLNQGEK